LVDYDEFVPLAVDLIQSFRARNRAKMMYSQKDVEVDEVIMKAISTMDLERITDQCLEKIYEVDTKRYGLIRIPELKRCLNAAAVHTGLRDNEISMICQLLPRDQFDRCKYNTQPDSFFDILSKVRFMTMKNAMIESQGSGLQKYLLDLCRDEEGRLNEAHEKGAAAITGAIPFRTLINILSNSARLSLSRLQVLVIMSEAHVQEGMINYFQFIPVVAKAIEIMFEPKALRQRAELIEKTDLSPEGLIQGMSTDAFEQRLLTLFKSYDIERSGALDQNEFIACLESLDLQLTYAESVALFHSADREHSGMVDFEGFISFFANNLVALEREKQIRLHTITAEDDEDDDGAISSDRDSLPSSVQEGRSLPSRSSFMSASYDETTSDFAASVTERCLEVDIQGSGCISFEQFEEVFSEVFTRDLCFSYTSEFLLDFFGK
jgi:Ca2+-binding EF-hand superfamily protein